MTAKSTPRGGAKIRADLERELAELAHPVGGMTADVVWDVAIRVGRFLRAGGAVAPVHAPDAGRAIADRLAALDFAGEYARLAARLRRSAKPLAADVALAFVRRRDDAQAAYHAMMAAIDPATSCGEAEANRRFAAMRALWIADEEFFTEFAGAFLDVRDALDSDRSDIADTFAVFHPWYGALRRAWEDNWAVPIPVRATIPPARPLTARRPIRKKSREHAARIDRAFRHALDLPARSGVARILDALAPGAAAADDDEGAQRMAFASLADRLAADIGVLRIRLRAPGECVEVTGGVNAVVDVDVAIDRAGALRFVFADARGAPLADAEGATIHLGKRWSSVKDGVAVLRCENATEFYRRLRLLPDSLAVVWPDGRILYGEPISR